MSDARKRAEAWLAENDGAAWCRDVAPLLRDLLAEPAPGVTESARPTEEQWRYLASAEAQTRTEQAAVRRERAEVERLRALLAEQGAGGANPDIPDSCRVDEDGCCLVCGRDVEGCYACSHAAGLPLAPPPAPEAHGCPVEGEPGHESCVGCGRPVRAEATETAPAPSEAVREGCTGIAASWCPVHGTCTCPRREDGSYELNMAAKGCPLHGEETTHADAEVAALDAPSPPAGDEVREAAEELRRALATPGSDWQSPMDALLAALSSPAAPAKDEVREAAEQWLPSGSDMADRFGGDE